MDTRSKERLDERPTVETPEDVAVLYSWANLHGAKYRDFSASRREYRAQLRHRAAEQAREQELRAQAEAEMAVRDAERAGREAERIAGRSSRAQESEAQREQALRQAEDAARVAAAERIEAARRAEAAAQAEASAERERREIAEANASARRQAAQYADSEVRRRQTPEMESDAELPGSISDPYTPQPRAVVSAPEPAVPEAAVELRPTRYRSVPERGLEPAIQRERNSMRDGEQGRRELEEQHGAEYADSDEPAAEQVYRPVSGAQRVAGRVTRGDERTAEYAAGYDAPQAAPTSRAEPNDGAAPAAEPPPPPRRPQGYRPDDASGVREIYRGPGQGGRREAPPAASRPQSARPQPERHPHAGPPAPLLASVVPARVPDPGHRRTMWAGSAAEERAAGPLAQEDRGVARAAQPEVQAPPAMSGGGSLQDGTPRRRRQDMIADARANGAASSPGSGPQASRSADALRAARPVESYRPAAPTGRPLAPAQTALPWQPAQPVSAAPPLAARMLPGAEPVAPAWLNPALSAEQDDEIEPPPMSSVTDTLQHSRERVASRWYALKGVFDQPGQERAEPQPVRQKEVRTPVLAVFSLAGGVGKTSLVATLGRALSSLGEKVLLTDTTSHGLLPFYFGASELRQGTVRTFSPPSGSTDAPIYLVSYDVDSRTGDESQEALVEEITSSGRGTHRVLLDLSAMSSWLLRRMAHLNPTVLVPVAPDMNSVISLQAVEKFFHGMTDSEGAPAKVFYVLNQFDASLPLHLDVREVLRRQLGERLLPFVIRRSPAVSESLAEGMTIIDYAPEAPVAEDYLNVATWLRSQAAPATAGFRNVRWSER